MFEKTCREEEAFTLPALVETSLMPPDYALMNQLLFEGKHEPVKKMTEDALAEGRPAMEVLEEA
jgi:hypothetical protein